MPVVSRDQLVQLQQNPANIRNICIVAHVDHGKTSLTDALLATNGIISPRLAGKVRYLDSRPDEQLRGITMESSAISLHFSMLRRESEKEAQLQQEYLINLIDSPGHIDFSSEVSVASRLCDGAVVLVDAVEGVCSQTVTVLRETWIEHLQPILVINKIDRLVTELKMSPSEAYAHLSKILEQVNAVVGTFFQGERMEQDLRWRERIEEQVAAKTAKTHAKAEQDVSAKAAATTRPEGEGSADDKPATVGFVEKDDEDIYFAPEKNNVVFSSALDGWGFTVRQFATLYEKKLGIKKAALEKVLWGDYYLDPKTRRVLGHKHLKGRSLKPMFVQLVLENIWAVYDATTGRGNAKGDPSSAQKILDSLNITLPTHVLRSKDPRSVLTSLFAAWLPLSTAILVSVVEYLPSPLVAQAARLPSIIHASPGAAHVDERLRAAMVESKSEKGQPVVAYVSKMIAVPESQLPHNRRRQGGLTAEEAREAGRRKRAEIAKAHALASAAEADGTGGLAEMMHDTSLGTSRNGIHEEASEPVVEDREHLIGFSRIYSGVLSVGDDVYILRPKFSPAYPDAHPQPIRMTVTALYLMMGRNLESLDSVPAGVVFGVAGLEGHILKSGTLCSQVAGGINLAGLNMGSQPIVRVALEPTNPGDLDKMIHGLRLLEQSDPSAEYEVLESGEHVIATAGELHLERCLKDLRERFAKCELQAGEPIVPYRETIVSASEMAPPKHKDLSRGTVLAVTASKQLTVRLNVRPLPAAVTEFLIENVSAIRRLQSQQRAKEEQERKKRRQQRQRQQQQQQQQQQQADDGEGLEGLIGGPNEQSTPSPEDDDGGEKQPRDLRTLSLADFRHGLQQAFSTAKTDKDLWNDVVERVVAFGPRRVGPNLLIDSTEAGLFRRFLRDAEHSESAIESSSSVVNASGKSNEPSSQDHETSSSQRAEPRSQKAAAASTGKGTVPEDVLDKISYAVQLATAQGPLSHEPMQGMCVSVEDVSIPPSVEHEDVGGTISVELMGALTSEAIKTVRDAVRQGFLDWSPRLLLAMYSCEIQASAEVLGKVYAVLTRRRGRILSESLKEGTAFFTIQAVMPVAESFGFSDEMRKRTSGGASPQLVFHGYDMLLDQDPFWVPSTDEEMEDLGSTADRENVAKRYMDAVRTRKGLFVSGRKLVERAERQKTLKR